jgi:MoxR-like ATPase
MMSMTALAAVPDPPTDLATAVAALNSAAEETKLVVVESEPLVDAIVLGTMARRHVYVAGAAGVGKTFSFEEWSKHLAWTYFYVQMRPDMKREEMFGPLKMSGMQQDRYEHKIEGYAPTADALFLDEIKDGMHFLRQLLNMLNERWFVNDGARMDIPLKFAGGGTNFWIDEPELAALFDRFTLRLEQEAIKTTEGFLQVINGRLDRAQGIEPQRTVVTREQLDVINRAVRTCTVSQDMRQLLAKLRKDAADEKLTMSPRRWGDGLECAQAAAVRAGRDYVTEDDFRVFNYVLPNHPDDFKPVRDLCKNFRDKYTEAVEQARDAITEQMVKLDVERDKKSSGGAVEMKVLTDVNRTLKEVRERIAASMGEHQSRDSAPFDRLLAQIGEAEQWIHKQVLGG